MSRPFVPVDSASRSIGGLATGSSIPDEEQPARTMQKKRVENNLMVKPIAAGAWNLFNN